MKLKMKMKRLFILSLFLFAFNLLPILSQPITANAASVNDGQNDIKLNVNSKSLVTDSSYTLKVYNLSGKQRVSFKSDSSSIASVDKEGVINAKKVGDAVITVTVKEGFKTVATLKCTITVGPPASSVVIPKGSMKLKVNQKKYVRTILKPNNTVEEAVFTSSDDSVVTVDSNGKVTGISEGKATIYATISNKDYAICKITVVSDNVDDED